ncbi:MAG: alkaline phosphatase family protein, partial [Chloroflexota bacterium]|nr:alkaline phosphatase family protein [Chloroflexota bacterium]
RNTNQYFLFYSNLYNLARTLALFVADFLHEIFAATWQLARNERPRVRRFGVYPIVRSATTSILRELSTFTVAGDMFRGVPAIYTTYVAYDEVAHHSGTERGDALRVLRQLDRDIGRLAKVAAEAPRPYHLIVLSDHGQTQGATFRQRYGESISGVVEGAIHRSANGLSPEVVHPERATDEGWEMVSVLLTDFLKNDTSGHPLFERALGRRMRDGRVAIGPDGQELDAVTGQESGKVVVLASGNLGLISFTGARRRMTIEEIDALHAKLMPALIAHPGIGFVVVETEDRGPLAIGRSGFHALRDDRVHGTSPLEGYSPHVPALLRRASGFRNAPDILLMGAYWPETNEVAAFEELVSSHGGLGGDQSTPFILSPVELDLGTMPIVGAAALHQVFKGWLTQSGGTQAGDES